MPEKVMSCPFEDPKGVCKAVCIHTRKIMDSARDKDCIEGLRFYPEKEYEGVISRAVSVKGGEATLLHVYVDVEPIHFNRGYYSVDMRFFYQVTLQVYLGCPAPVKVKGLCVFDKRAILCGGEGGAKIFSSEMTANGPDEQLPWSTSNPIAVVEAVDPIVLDARIGDRCCKNDCCDCQINEVPDCINGCFEGGVSCCDDSRHIYVTLGQFSIVRLERDTQLLIPMYDYCVPCKESTCSNPSVDPCGSFSRVNFPVDSFFPSNSTCASEDCDDGCSCHCRK